MAEEKELHLAGPHTEEHSSHDEPGVHLGKKEDSSADEGKPGDKKGLKKNKVTIIAAVVGIAITIYLYYRSKNSAAASTAATSVPTTDTGTAGTGGGSGGGWGGGGWPGSNDNQTSPTAPGSPTAGSDQGQLAPNIYLNEPPITLITVTGGTTGGMTTPPTPKGPSGNSFGALLSAANNALNQGPTTQAGIGNAQGMVTAALIAAGNNPSEVAQVAALEGRTGGATTVSSAYGTAASAAPGPGGPSQQYNPGYGPYGPTNPPAPPKSNPGANAANNAIAAQQTAYNNAGPTSIRAATAPKAPAPKPPAPKPPPPSQDASKKFK